MKMNNSIKTKILCSILSVLLLIQIVPFSTFAVEETTDYISSTNLNESVSEDIPNILYEIVDERDEYTKVYFLEDGSFYSITSPTPIHTLVGDEWVDIYSGFQENNEISTVKDAVESIQSSSSTAYSLRRSNVVQNEESSLIINSLDCIELPGGGYRFGELGGILMKSSLIGKYANKNRLITYAGLSAECSVTLLNNETSIPVRVCEETGEWTEESAIDDLDLGASFNSRIMDLLVLTTSKTYTWDITDLYSRWDRGVTDNNGIFMMHDSTSSLIISSPCIVVRYIEVEENDLDFTYHSVDMGAAGTLHINDCTNAIRIEQELLSFPSINSDIILGRTYNSMLPSYSNCAGIGFTFNFESSIELTQYYADWTMVNGTSLRFVTTNPVVSDGDYKLWTSVNDIESNNNTTELWIKSSELNKINNYSNNIDYRNIYIISNGFKYNFEQSGKLNAVSDANSNNIIISITYVDGKICEIKNSDNTKMKFTYIVSDIGYSYISSITLENESNTDDTATDNQLSSVSFSSTYDEGTKTTTQITSFNNGKQVAYTFDFNGNLINALDEKGNRYIIDYKTYSDGYTGNLVAGYSKYYEGNTSYNVVGNEQPDEFLTIDSKDTYKRVFTSENNKTEKIFYDRSYNLIVHMDTEGVYRFAEYNENGFVASYVFDEQLGNSYIFNNDFESGFGVKIAPWSKSGNDSKVSIVKNEPDNVHSGKYSLQISANSVYSDHVNQIIKLSNTQNSANVVFTADKTLVFGGWGKAKNAIPKEENFFGIIIESAPAYDESGNLISTDELVFEEYTSLYFDTCTNDEWQYKLKAFKLETDSVLKIKLVGENQTNSVYFDDIVLYETKENRNDLEDIITSSPIVYSYNDDGSINSETMIWTQESGNNISMGTSYTYQNGKLSEYKDINNNSTFYNSYNSENGLISEIGHIKDNTGTILDATTVEYDMNSLLKSTSIAINSIVPESNDSVESEGNTGENNETTSSVSQYIISTDYDIASEGIVGVTHNGVKYCFEYNNDGTLKSVHAEPASIEDGTTISGTETDNEYSEDSYRVDYTYNTEGDISVIDYSNNYRVKHISSINEFGEKTVTIQCYTTNDDSTDKELIKSYIYNFDSNGILKSVYDSGTGITITYNDDGYAISNDAVLYQRINEDGRKTEYYAQAQYNEPNNTDEDIVTTSSSTISYDENNVKTSSSTVSIQKNVNNFVSIFNYSRSSVVDYFNRIESKETTLEYTRPKLGSGNAVIGTVTGSIAVNTDYDYMMLNDGRTSGLVSEYTSTIIDNSTEGSTEQSVLLSYNRKYEYDNKGNIKYVYFLNDSTETPCEYYEYDEANQLVTEINFDNKLVARYTYNAGGNLIAKIYYSFNNLTFDKTNRKIISLGEETNRITYGYDSVWTDRLISYNGTEISYDKMGNPLNFIGKDFYNKDVIGTLTWSGDLLTSFETNDNRYEYQYDANGYRTLKMHFELNKNSTSDTNKWNKIYDIRYIWDNGVLTGILLVSYNNGIPNEEQSFNLIYDEEGTPVGYITMLGVPYYFKKDINENVLSLVYIDGSEPCSYSYDSWGLPTVVFNGNWAQNLVMAMTVPFCPATYHGYLYDYETGLYFNKSRCYSPCWGRYLNPEDAIKLTENSINPLDANLYLFCNNNTVNNLDKTASWSRIYTGVTWTANGFDVEMSKIFSSRAFCSVFAGQIIKTYGSWDLFNGYSYKGMNSIRIASDLFAHCIGKYAQSAINKVNTCWGDGWILNNKKSNTISISNDDKNAWKYEKIWYAASALKAYAQKEGIYIIL